MSSEGTDTSNGRSRGRSRGRGRGRGNRGRGRARFTNGADSERDGAPQPVIQSNTGQDVAADVPASTPVSAPNAPVAQISAPGSRGQPRRRSNASRGTSGNHPPPTVSDTSKSAAIKEVPPHLAGPGLDADVLVNKVKALATHSKNSSVDSRYVPAMGLDWADEEEDPESLPDLSQWAVPKPGVAVDQMQSVKEEEAAPPAAPPTAPPERPNDKTVPSGSPEPPTSDRDDRLSGISSEPDSRAPYPNHGFRGRGRGRGRGHAHLSHLPFHPANLQRRQQTVAATPGVQQTAPSSSPRHEKTADLPPRSQERAHTRPVIDKGALARIGLTLAGPKPPAGSPRRPSAVPS